MKKNIAKLLVLGSMVAMLTVPVYAGNNDLGPDGKVKPPEKHTVIQTNKIEVVYDKPIVVINGAEYINIEVLKDLSLGIKLDTNKEKITVKKGNKEYVINFSEKGIHPINKDGKIFIPMKETFDEIGVKYMYRNSNIVLENDKTKLDLAYKNISIKDFSYRKPASYKKVEVTMNHIKNVNDDKKDFKNKDLGGLVPIMNGNEYINTNIFDKIGLKIEKNGDQIIKVINEKNNKWIELSNMQDDVIGNGKYLPVKELFEALDVTFSIDDQDIEINNHNIKEKFDVIYIK
ncbi:hypothetical protein [Crassaminicella profunda]|uniref:hypothetical protein n=1 Tax=Crassaminicella profunda TaxID=1286698 RepID=UPI001CA62193|nr:hypothetical protein [Crassaminicella profunda]QZY54951.1 hypothetical protein K7H06_18330 [Crassaminicella profunda]